MAATEDCCLGRAIEFVLVLQYDTLDVFKVGPTPVFALIESGHYSHSTWPMALEIELFNYFMSDLSSYRFRSEIRDTK